MCPADAFLFLDADDWLAADALDRLSDALEADPAVVAAYGPFVFVDHPDQCSPTNREGIGRGARNLWGRRYRHGDFLLPLLERNLFANGGHVLIRTEALRRAGPFHPDLTYGEDWELFTRLALQGPFAPASGRRPVLFVRRRAEGACLGLGADPASFRSCMDAVFNNPALEARLGKSSVSRLRTRREAENLWVAGRAKLRQKQQSAGLALLRRSLLAKPSVKRSAIVVAAHLTAALQSTINRPLAIRNRRPPMRAA